MRTLILYTSGTGNTQKYAEEIAAAVKADVMPSKKFKEKMIDEYDTIVFGGWIMGGVIKGLDPFLAKWDLMSEKNVIVFAVGMSVPTKETRANIISANLLDMYHLRFYQLRGSFDYSKLKFPNNFLFKNSIRLINKDPEASEDQKYLAYLVENPLVCHDDEGVNKVISVLNKLATVVEA